MKPSRLVVVGAGSAGRMAVAEMRKDPGRMFEPVAFVDDDPAKQGQVIDGLEVRGGRDQLPQILDASGAHEILIALPSAHGDVIRDIVATCRSLRVRFRVVPPILEIIRGDVRLDQIRSIEPEDLLGRESVEPDQELIAAAYAGKRVLVTGAGGSIGRELARQVLTADPEMVYLVGRGENSLFESRLLLPESARDRFQVVLTDIRRVDELTRLMETTRPHVVLHAAAHKHVTFMELFPEEAVFNNILATQALADLAQAVGVERVVMLSTDKAVNPRGVMGASKRAAELLLMERPTTSTRFMAVRFGNVLASRGSVVPLFQRQIAAGGPVTVSDAQVCRYFMTVREAAMLVLMAGASGQGGETFILDMGAQIKILDLARELITLSGLRPEEDIPIRIVGLQPGEKVQEELVHDFESLEPTDLPKIRVAKRTRGRARPMLPALPDLRAAAESGDRARIRQLLADLVPEAQLSAQPEGSA